MNGVRARSVRHFPLPPRHRDQGGYVGSTPHPSSEHGVPFAAPRRSERPREVPLRQPPGSPEIDSDSTEAWEKIPAGRNLFPQRPPILFLEESPEARGGGIGPGFHSSVNEAGRRRPSQRRSWPRREHVTLVDVAVVRFVACLEQAGVELRHCPRFVDAWMALEKKQLHQR
jgi:hypothetical protein